jgi:hypothetical protein
MRRGHAAGPCGGAFVCPLSAYVCCGPCSITGYKAKENKDRDGIYADAVPSECQFFPNFTRTHLLFACQPTISLASTRFASIGINIVSHNLSMTSEPHCTLASPPKFPLMSFFNSF